MHSHSRATRMSTLIEGDEIQRESMQDATRNVLEECRMVLPGIQALFGFQLIAVINQNFSRVLSEPEQQAHLVALAMSALAIALVMGPAAYHRQVHPHAVSKAHLRASSWMLTIGMLPLMLAILIDIYLMSRVITHSVGISAAVTGLLSLAFIGLWIVFPRVIRYRQRGTLL